MRLLISFVNSPSTLGGFDWDTGELFWQARSGCPAVCGICYDRNALLATSDNGLLRYGPDDQRSLELPGRYPSKAHSVHMIDESTIGVADTGNSAVRIFSSAGKHLKDLAPVAVWRRVPHDALHLNDFAVTPHGIIASCFDFRPWRSVQARYVNRKKWATSGVGVLINLSDGHGSGRLVGCGLDHPHSLLYRSPYLYNCSSSQGTFHCWEFTDRGTTVSVKDTLVTRKHFLRGAYYSEGLWYLGGSTTRHCDPLDERMAIYRLDETTGSIERKALPTRGEIYDILPWREDVMRPLIHNHFGEASDPARFEAGGAHHDKQADTRSDQAQSLIT